ncbi:MAG TPA: DUF1501 domain-containing protein [Fimbriimonadaceae bacterium]|nr:DUF1501 domain-containing protein [Fimbriimonadaceae bacterium]
MDNSDRAMQDVLRHITRRSLLKTAGFGIGTLALGSLMAEDGFAALLAGQNPRTDPLAPKPPHFAPKAKRVIYLFMVGAPSQLDLFDPKPMLVTHNAQPCPAEYLKGERFAFIKGTPMLLGSPFKFKACGQSGQMISEVLPHMQEIADDISVIRSMHTDEFNHAPAQIMLNTGFRLPGRPSMGSWLTYGLGSESRDLPGFVVLISGSSNPDGGKTMWSSGFLPSTYQGIEFRSHGDPVLYVQSPDGITHEVRREELDAIRDLNVLHSKSVHDPEIDTRIAAYEMAYRMQTSVPDLMDVSKEKPETLEMYGAKQGETSFANNCLLARRLVERGVRFVQLYHRGWDHHGESAYDSLGIGLPKLCGETDKAAVALVKDLKQRGLLDETLVIWGGEFGRTPMNEARDGSKYLGRDHHPHAYSIWMAGGGIKPGLSYGSTDELGYMVAKDPVHVHDLNATVLHLMGLDHTRLTYKFQGRNFRLTDVYGNVQTGLVA